MKSSERRDAALKLAMAAEYTEGAAAERARIVAEARKELRCLPAGEGYHVLKHFADRIEKEKL